MASKILVTGSDGFIGKNIVAKLSEDDNYSIETFSKRDNINKIFECLKKCDAIIHLAGVNRPIDENDFTRVNIGLTETICNAVNEEFSKSGRKINVIHASSTQVNQDNNYGRSKLKAEMALEHLYHKIKNTIFIYRLPGVFGKWCRPNYNSVVATFCYNIARGLKIDVHDVATKLKLVYIDDVVNEMISALKLPENGFIHKEVNPTYHTSLGDLVEKIKSFENCRKNLIIEQVGSGLDRALYSTYISYLPTNRIQYPLKKHSDERGVFVEMLKTKNSGQFSYFKAFPGVTRGGHYHHTKTEKFLVIQGKALFRFRELYSDNTLEIKTSDDIPEVVDTIPGYVHDITNIGNNELIVMLWANENFNHEKPDTFESKV